MHTCLFMVVLLMVSFVAGDDPEDADFDPEYGAMTSHKSNKVIKYFFFSFNRDLYFSCYYLVFLLLGIMDFALLLSMHFLDL